MNVKRFTARNARDALGLVREAFGGNAVVLHTRPCAEGVEVLAMAPDAVPQFESAAVPAAKPVQRAAGEAPPVSARAQQALEQTSAAQDAERLAMSTLSFQDYVRERMLRRRKAEQEQPAGASAAPPRKRAAPEPAVAIFAADAATVPAPAATPPATAAAPRPASRDETLDLADPTNWHDEPAAPVVTPSAQHAPTTATVTRGIAPSAEPSMSAEPALARRNQAEMMSELRAIHGLIEERFGALAFMEKLQRQPRQAALARQLLYCGFSPALTRKLSDMLPSDVDEAAWAASMLERNLTTGEHDSALEDVGGVYAFIGSTGVGKTTSTAKLAAAFAMRHGAGNLGLITLDAYRVAAHEQLRAYGRILGVPVHTAHDRASLDDLLDLLSGKRMVLIDTAGMAQRDERTRELLEMLNHRAVQRLLVVNAASQGETIEDVLRAYRASSCAGVVLSKLDEAVKIGPALDAMIRNKLKVLAVANGQRVPEDWHRLSAATLVQRALRGGGTSAWKVDDCDVSLVFAGEPAQRTARPAPAAAAL